MRWRVAIAVLLITLFAVRSADSLSLVGALTGSAAGDVGHDAFSLNEARCRALQKQLPAHGAVGYHAEKPSAAWFDEIRQRYLAVEYQQYATVQYGLAPMVLDPATDHTITIFASPTAIRLSGPSLP
jgi:hypothetical protein